MNLDYLKQTCIDACYNAYVDYMHYIDNALFTVDESIIEIEINAMKATIGQKVLKKMLAKYDLSPEQMKYVSKTLEHYKRLTVKRAVKYYEL